jgi:hypothetical protein
MVAIQNGEKTAMELNTLLWSILIGLVWLAAIRAPAADARAIDEQDNEDRRLWHAADLRNQIDRNN